MPATTTVPQPVRLAILAVWALLGLLVLRAILTVAFSEDLIDAWVENSSSSLPREIIADGAPAYTGVAIGVLVIAVVLGFAAVFLGKGARWARVVAFVFAALAVLGVVASLIPPSLPVLVVINVVVGLLAVGVIVALCTGDARRFFAK